MTALDKMLATADEVLALDGTATEAPWKPDTGVYEDPDREHDALRAENERLRKMMSSWMGKTVIDEDFHREVTLATGRPLRTMDDVEALAAERDDQRRRRVEAELEATRLSVENERLRAAYEASLRRHRSGEAVSLPYEPMSLPRVAQIANDYKEVTVGEGRSLAREVLDLRRQVECYKTHDSSWAARDEQARQTIADLRSEVEILAKVVRAAHVVRDAVVEYMAHPQGWPKVSR